MTVCQLIMSNITDFQLDCTRWCRFTILNRVGKKSQCCWRGNYKRRVIISLALTVHTCDWWCDSVVTFC